MEELCSVTKQESITQMINDIQDISFETFGTLGKINSELKDNKCSDGPWVSTPQPASIVDKLFALRALVKNIRWKSLEIASTI